MGHVLYFCSIVERARGLLAQTMTALSRGRTPYLFNDNEWVMNRFCLFSINITDSDAIKG